MLEFANRLTRSQAGALRDHRHDDSYWRIQVEREAAFNMFLRDREQDYGRLDRRCEALTLSERRIGDYGDPG